MRKKVQVVSFQSLSAHSGAGMARLGHMLSKELQKRDMLQNFIVHSKGKFDTEFPSQPVSFFSRYYLYVINKLVSIFSIPSYKSRYWQEVVFDWFCQWQLKKDTHILFTTNAFMGRTFKKAKRLGIVVVLLPGTPEENYIYDIVNQENKRTGIYATDAYTYKKRLKFFNDSIEHVDKVIGSLPTVYSSYRNAGHKAEVVQLLGHMTPNFKNVQSNVVNREDFHVGYIAHSVLLKGLQYLLAAWEDITKDATQNITLHIAGPTDAGVDQYIRKKFSGLPNIKWHGHVSDIPAFMNELDLLVVPSLIDGGPMTALEAAHNGVPCIITDHCGSAELLSRNTPGCWVIPIRDKDAIRDKILFAYNNREACRQMGFNAKHNLETYSMESFIVELADYLENKV
jgi:glycosyltransferase involved in cell wall biosynthesis